MKMEFQSRQLVHLFGFLFFLGLIVWLVNAYVMQQPPQAAVNLNNYYWLATVNLHYQSDVGLSAIRKGEATMLVASRRDVAVNRLHVKYHGVFDDPAQVISLHHFDHQGDQVISVGDPLYKKLYLISFVKGRTQLVSLDQSQIRAIQIHRDAKGRLQYKAVLSNGHLAYMETAPSNQVYNPRIG